MSSFAQRRDWRVADLSMAPFGRKEIHLAEHAQFGWIEKKDLFSVDWAPADIPIVHELQEKWVKLVSSNPS